MKNRCGAGNKRLIAEMSKSLRQSSEN